ncbi:hypothetical protein ACIQ7D_10160 [Streptomyces sp. NPDC096310]|uniref:hypothetical protein n=1 Tax=Streptomyces sp. NPDC096310 TaxID=3366082 RepID=UPI00382BED1A
MPAPSATQIVLFSSGDTGTVAAAHGEQYDLAHRALESSGFERRANGTYLLPPSPAGEARTTVKNLIRTAELLQITVATSSRRYLGDIADSLAEQLPGTWEASVSVYSHPVWQEDLAACLWDSGELMNAVTAERILYGATLVSSEGIELLLIDRPGHPAGYVVGALSFAGFDNSHEDACAPDSFVAEESDLAAGLTERFLPAYQQALRARRTIHVASALDRIRTRYRAWEAMVASTRYSNATPVDIDALGVRTEEFLNSAWRDFLTVLDHGPTLLEQYPHATTRHPENAGTLARLSAALTDAEAVLADTTPRARHELNARMWPAIETWLTHGEQLLLQAQPTAPAAPPALPLYQPPRELPQGGRPAHRR